MTLLGKLFGIDIIPHLFLKLAPFYLTVLIKYGALLILSNNNQVYADFVYFFKLRLQRERFIQLQLIRTDNCFPLIQVGLLIDRLTQFLAKLKFTLTVLVTSWTEKKQRRQSAGTLLALNASLGPLVLAVVALSALLSAPLLPLFTLPIFLVGFPRPQRSWPGPVGTACPCPDSIFYQQMSGSLASALRTAFARGSMGQLFLSYFFQFYPFF